MSAIYIITTQEKREQDIFQISQTYLSRKVLEKRPSNALESPRSILLWYPTEHPNKYLDEILKHHLQDVRQKNSNGNLCNGIHIKISELKKRLDAFFADKDELDDDQGFDIHGFSSEDELMASKKENNFRILKKLKRKASRELKRNAKRRNC